MHSIYNMQDRNNKTLTISDKIHSSLEPQQNQNKNNSQPNESNITQETNMVIKV